MKPDGPLRDHHRQVGATRHAADRLWERYGIRLTRERVYYLRAAIESGKYPVEYREGLNLPVYVVPLEDEYGVVQVPVLWDVDTRCIVTVLPK